MKEILQQAKEKYKTLKEKLDAKQKEIEKETKIGEKLALDFNIADDRYEEAHDTFNRIEKRLEKNKYNFISKKHINHIFIVVLGTAAIFSAIAAFNISLGLITEPIIAYLGGVALGCIAGMIDITFLWDKLHKKYNKQFEELESTKRTRDVSDKAYANKLQAEEQLRNTQGKVIEHTKKLNQIKTQRNKIQEEINELKQKTFDEVFVKEETKETGITLTLK